MEFKNTKKKKIEYRLDNNIKKFINKIEDYLMVKKKKCKSYFVKTILEIINISLIKYQKYRISIFFKWNLNLKNEFLKQKNKNPDIDYTCLYSISSKLITYKSTADILLKKITFVLFYISTSLFFIPNFFKKLDFYPYYFCFFF